MKEVKVEVKGEEPNKDETQMTLLEGQGQENKDPETFYKKDDFFDAISCEALERAKGPMNRPDWRKELELNAETFGLSGGRRGFYRGGRGGFYNRNPVDSRWFYDAPRRSYGNRFNGQDRMTF